VASVTATDEALLGLEIGDTLFGVEAKQASHLGHDFRADAVAAKKKKLVSGHGRLAMRRRLLKRRVGLGKQVSGPHERSDMRETCSMLPGYRFTHPSYAVTAR
jgi:hypothetical protein